MMKKFIILTLILITSEAFAFDNYVSPESYAVNEADLTDYRYIAPSPKLNIDTLENMRFDKESAEISGNNIEQTGGNKSKKSEKVKKDKKTKAEKPYESRLIYKTAKWWVDQRYKREEPHHGTKHEIKVKAREDYERRLEENINNLQ